MEVIRRVSNIQAWTWTLFINRRVVTSRLPCSFLSSAPVWLGRDGSFPLQWKPASQLKTPKCTARLNFFKSAVTMATGGEDKGPPGFPQHTNRLSMEKSPYLLQHAHNPVDWFPWGQEAFEKAKREDKPIFLSVGYSTCHWCHVMERESFEDAQIGKVLSDNFVCIKVDREERPDVDKVYMTFVQQFSGGGGWPMSVWLTPDLRPFIGGTYFPPKDSLYRPGFKTVLLRIAEQWKNNRDVLVTKSERILEALRRGTAITAKAGQMPPSCPDVMEKCFQQLASSYDEEYGGFSKFPKFPTPVNLNFFFSYWAHHKTSPQGALALQMALHTLKMMALGGIHDHVAQISGDEFFADVARNILCYVSRDLSDKSGGFYSAEDADSYPTVDSTEKKEGAFCVWTQKEIKRLLTEPLSEAPEATTIGDVFINHYGVKEEGNVAPEQDPHGELKGQNVLIVRCSLELTAARFGLSVERVKEILKLGRERLAKVREQRPRPHLDSKMLSSWNGLMISGFSRVGAVLGEKAFVERAEQSAQFLKDHLWNPVDRRILRSCYKGEGTEVEQTASPILGFLDDYVFVIAGLLDLYEACLNPSWLEWAEVLQECQDALFWDKEGYGYFSSDPSDPEVLLELKDDQDGAEPNPNSVSASNLLRLSHYLGSTEWEERSQQILAAFSDRLMKVPIALPEMVRVLMAHHHTLRQVVICGCPDSEDTMRLLSCVNEHFVPHKVLLMADGNADNFLYQRLPVLSTMAPQGGKATAYVCKNFTCSLPATTAKELHRLLLE
nr:PREDICTED: spermatogenesis-associated protein 20 isoform X2 [Lepisosteus oculatus]